MFWIIAYVFALFFLYGISGYFFEKKRKKERFSKKNIIDITVAVCLPYYSLAAMLIKDIGFSDDVKIVMFTIGSVLCVFVMYLSAKNRFK